MYTLSHQCEHKIIPFLGMVLPLTVCICTFSLNIVNMKLAQCLGWFWSSSLYMYTFSQHCEHKISQIIEIVWTLTVCICTNYLNIVNIKLAQCLGWFGPIPFVYVHSINILKKKLPNTREGLDSTCLYMYTLSQHCEHKFSLMLGIVWTFCICTHYLNMVNLKLA